MGISRHRLFPRLPRGGVCLCTCPRVPACGLAKQTVVFGRVPPNTATYRWEVATFPGHSTCLALQSIPCSWDAMKGGMFGSCWVVEQRQLCVVFAKEALVFSGGRKAGGANLSIGITCSLYCFHCDWVFFKKWPQFLFLVIFCSMEALLLLCRKPLCCLVVG